MYKPLERIFRIKSRSVEKDEKLLASVLTALCNLYYVCQEAHSIELRDLKLLAAHQIFDLLDWIRTNYPENREVDLFAYFSSGKLINPAIPYPTDLDELDIFTEFFLSPAPLPTASHLTIGEGFTNPNAHI